MNDEMLKSMDNILTDVIFVIQNTYIVYFFLAITFLLIGYFIGKKVRSNRINVGEAAVMRILSKSLSNRNYHLLNNITLPIENGSTQIDHILVSRYGIFVIESKHYSGWIFANPISKKWTQVIYNEKYRFLNPLHQNAGHVNRIRELLDFIPSNDIHSLIVFTGGAEIKTVVPKNVIHIEDLINFIKAFDKEVMSHNRLEFCVGRIESKRYQISKQTDIQHQESLRKKYGYLDQ